MSDEFKFYELPNNNVGGAIIPISQTPMPLAALTINTASNVVITIRPTLGWQSLTEPTTVVFKVWRGAPTTGTLVASDEESGESGFDRYRVTSFSHVDSGFASSQPVTYVITAETVGSGTRANIIGPVTFTVLSNEV